MTNETRFIFITLHDLFFWTFIVLERFQPAFSDYGCIHILKAPETKTSICTSYRKNFTRIPERFPDHVAELIIENQNLPNIDSTQLKNLPNLVNLTLNNNGIVKVDINSFEHVPQLISLRLSRNKLFLGDFSMPSKSLINLKNLHTLDLSNNPLGFVPDFYFQSLTKLKILNLSGANKGFYIETNGFDKLSSLQVLDLSNNHLTTLPEVLGKSLSSMQLQEFYLFENSWNCDCNLQWLKAWFSKHKSVKYSKDPSKDIPTNGVIVANEIQPKCAAPPQLTKKSLLSDSSIDSIRTVDFKCSPRIDTKDRKIEISKNQNVTFTCDFHANPGGSVSWSKNGLIVQSHWRRVYLNRSQGIQFKAWLTLVNVEEHDSGNWRCMLETQVSKVNATFELKVISPPSIVDLKSILKYVGIGFITLILLLVVIGIIIYCAYGFQIQNTRRPKMSLSKIITDEKDTPQKQTHTNYHIISKPGKEMGFNNKILISTLDKSQHYGTTLMDTNKAYIQPCLDQSHSPFSHYLVNGSSSVCPLHGELPKQKSSKIEDEVDSSGKKISIQFPLTDCNMAQSSAIPCPIHGDVLSYLSCPVSTISTTSQNISSPCLSSAVIVKPSKEYIVKVTPCNPAVVVTSNSTMVDDNYLSSCPVAPSFSYSTAI